MTPTLSRHRALRLCEVLAAVTEVVSSAEYLARPADRRPGGVEFWGDAEALTTLRSPRTHALVRRVADARTTDALHVLKVVASGTVLASSRPAHRLVGGLVSAGCHALLHPRHRLSSDGSDHASFVAQVGVALARGAGGSPPSIDAGLWFVALSSAMAYTAAGVAKLMSPGWRSGDAVLGVVRLRVYGDPALARYLDRVPGCGRGLEVAVVALECGFGLAWADRSGRTAWAVVLASLSFHLANARVMGLNRFLTAFAATYPAVLYTAGPRRVRGDTGPRRDDRFPRAAAALGAGAAVVGAALSVLSRTAPSAAGPSGPGPSGVRARRGHDPAPHPAQT
ncbi:hypothetical protein DMP17_44380 [Pseudonocardia sp. TMWB2A]